MRDDDKLLFDEFDCLDTSALVEECFVFDGPAIDLESFGLEFEVLEAL